MKLCKKMVISEDSNLHNGNSYFGKMACLYWLVSLEVYQPQPFFMIKAVHNNCVYDTGLQDDKTRASVSFWWIKTKDLSRTKPHIITTLSYSYHDTYKIIFKYSNLQTLWQNIIILRKTWMLAKDACITNHSATVDHPSVIVNNWWMIYSWPKIKKTCPGTLDTCWSQKILILCFLGNT